jgi:hypothetical protein
MVSVRMNTTIRNILCNTANPLVVNNDNEITAGYWDVIDQLSLLKQTCALL